MPGTPLVVMISVVVILTDHLHSVGSENSSSLYRKLYKAKLLSKGYQVEIVSEDRHMLGRGIGQGRPP